MSLPAYSSESPQLPVQDPDLRQPEEHEKPTRNQRCCVPPRWPRYAAASLHLFVASSSIAIIALVAHSLRTVSNTRDIKFGGINASWPTDLILRPAHYFLVVASLSLVASLVASLHSFIRRNSPTFSAIDTIFAAGAVILLALWITGDALQYQAEKTPKREILSWSCRRSESPTNSLVRYASTCTQQVRS